VIAFSKCHKIDSAPTVQCNLFMLTYTMFTLTHDMLQFVLRMISMAYTENTHTHTTDYSYTCVL